MAFTHNLDPQQHWGMSVKNIISRVWHGLIMAPAMQTRLRQVDALHAKSDKDLVALDLRREDIAKYVFRDMMYS